MWSDTCKSRDERDSALSTYMFIIMCCQLLGNEQIEGKMGTIFRTKASALGIVDVLTVQ